MTISRGRQWAVAIASCGNLLEWYDFSLYGFFAPILAALFFPAENPLASMLATFGVFASGFVMRLAGGLLFGCLADRFGRAAMLQLSVIMMAVPTTLIGLLPTYLQIGFAAPILLTLLRMIQGLSVGGEYATSVVLLVEHADRRKRGITACWATVASTGGTLLGAGTGALTTACLAHEQLITWGWRVPFILGSAVGLIAALARRNLHEPPEYSALKSKGIAPPPLGRLLKDHGRDIARIAGGICVNMVGFYLFFVYLSTHLSTQTGRSLSQAMWITTTGLMALVIFTPVMAGLSDRWGRRHLCLAGCAVLAFAGPVLFRLFETRDFFADLAGIIAFAGAFSLINATGSILLAETIPTRIRASVFSIAFNLSAAIFGGFAPFAATALIGLTANPVSPGFLLTGAAIISGISFWLSESSHSTVGWKSVLAEAKA